MVNQEVDVTKKVEECLTKIEELKQKNADNEEILSLLSSTLEEITPEDKPLLEGAKLNYMLAKTLLDVIHSRSEDENDIEAAELNEDDLLVAWENLQTARMLYLNGDDSSKYKTDLSNVTMALGEVNIEKGDYETAVNDFQECLKYRTECYPMYSREMADVLYLLGISQMSLAQTNALSSEDDTSLVSKAEENAKEAYETFKKTQTTLCHVCLDLALKEKSIEKKEDDVVKQVEGLKEKTEEMENLISIIHDLAANIEAAEKFSVSAVIEEEKKNVDSLRDLMNDNLEDDSEDFEEEEEEDDDDIVIDDIEMLKKSIKRDPSSEEDTSKRQKTEYSVCFNK